MKSKFGQQDSVSGGGGWRKHSKPLAMEEKKERRKLLCTDNKYQLSFKTKQK